MGNANTQRKRRQKQRRKRTKAQRHDPYMAWLTNRLEDKRAQDSRGVGQ